MEVKKLKEAVYEAEKQMNDIIEKFYKEHGHMLNADVAKLANCVPCDPDLTVIHLSVSL